MRRPFTPEEVAAIFSAPVFQGCAGDEATDEPGEHRVADWRFWIPLLLLATGARLEEVGQLATADVRREGGVLYLDLTAIADDEGDDAPDKSLKTGSSARRVPLHRLVLDAGFEAYLAERVAAGDKALFPELPRRGKKTRNASKRLNGLLASVGVKGKVLHSFRHLFKDDAREAELETAVHDALTGHAAGNVGARYGDGLSIRRLKEAIDRIEFLGFPGVAPPHGAFSPRHTGVGPTMRAKHPAAPGAAPAAHPPPAPGTRHAPVGVSPSAA